MGFRTESAGDEYPERELGPDPDGDEPDDDGADLGTVDMATDALAAARGIVSGREWPAHPARRPGSRSRFRRRVDPQYSGSGTDDRDPASIALVVERASSALGWADELGRARVFGQWSAIVGADIAAHCEPLSLAESQLRVGAESTAWAAQLRLMAPQILEKLTADLPPGLITKIIFTGPTGPSWRRGPWSMSGGRGVRDTYG